jgi:hypothetical protein
MTPLPPRPQFGEHVVDDGVLCLQEALEVERIIILPHVFPQVAPRSIANASKKLFDGVDIHFLARRGERRLAISLPPPLFDVF